MFCSICGASIPEGARACARCGWRLPAGSLAAARPATPVYAGFWRRALASLLDGLILVAFAQVVGSALSPAVLAVGAAGLTGWLGAPVPNPAEVPLMATLASRVEALLVGVLLVNSAILLVVNWLYCALMESSTRQATLGKGALGIVVTDMEGARLSFGRASARYWAGLASGLTLGIGYLMAGFGEKKQALHDMLAGCLVVER